MDKSQRPAAGTTSPKAGHARKLITVLSLTVLGGGSIALSSTTQPPYQQPDRLHWKRSVESHADATGWEKRQTGSVPVRHDLHAGSAVAASGRTSRGTGGAENHSQHEREEILRRSKICLSLNVYWEARNQSTAGQLAVAQVTMNRVRDRRYPSDVCQVVYDHKQFSWYWDGKSDRPREARAWEKAMIIASAAIAGSGHVELQGVTHYHAVYSQPYWRDYMTRVTVIGEHIFYAD